MPTVEVELPEDLLAQLDRLAEEDFISEEEAIEELLTAGLDAYSTPDEEPRETDIADEFAEDIWDTAEDPGAEPGDDYAY